MKTQNICHLTSKQKTFCDAFLNGISRAEAYRLAYNTNAKSSVISVAAAKLIRTPSVRSYIREAQNRIANEKHLTRVRKREVLAEIVLNPKTKASDRIKAIEVDNRMCGHDQPNHSTPFGLDDLMRLVRNGS